MPQNESSSRDDRVNEAIAAYLGAMERGEAPDREKFLAEHAEIAAELRSFFADQSQLRKMAVAATLPQATSTKGPCSDPNQPTVHLQIQGIPSSDQALHCFGDYELLQEIARGGMGVVFKGRDTGIGREVAVKVLLERHRGETELLQRFVEEAQIAGQLQHPGVTPVYEMGQLPDQRPYFTMKLVKGETLSKLLRDRPDPTHDRLRFLKIFEQVCQTLAYAHSRGVIHRDLKPANIMVGAFGEVQVMDWGLGKVLGAGGSKAARSAKAAPADVSVIRTARSDATGDSGGSSSQTQAGSVMGTPAYMPPEQAMGQIDYLDQRADVFGLGAILCEILTGQPPYIGSDAWQVQFKAVRAELTDAIGRLDCCGADAQLTGLARRALAPQPDERPADAGVVAAEVTAYLEGVETRLRHAELAEVQAKTRAIEERRRRNQALVLSGAVLAVLLIGVIGTTWGLIRAGRALEAERRATESARRGQYDSDLELAGQVWENPDGAARNVADLLSRQMPEGGQSDLREFAWRLLWTELRKNSGILPGHDRGARLVAYSSDGQLVSLDGDLTLRHWDLPAVRTPWTQALRDAGHVSCWAISADARWIALGAGDTVYVFDARTGEKQRASIGAALVLALCFSADGGKLAAVWGDGTAQIWDSASGEQTAALHVQEIEKLAEVEGAVLAADGQTLLLIGYPTNERLTWLGPAGEESPVGSGHQSSVYSMALTRDGKMAATGDSNGQVCLWDASTHEQIVAGLRIHHGDVKALVFSPDGTRLATGGADGMVTVCDVAVRGQVLPLKGHRGRIQGLRFSPDGQSLASASDDGDVRVWKPDPAAKSRVIGSPELPVFSVAWSPDGRRLAVGSRSMADDGIVKVFDAESQVLVQEIRAARGRVLGLAFSADGRKLATGGYDSYLRLWDPVSGEQVGELKGLPSEATDNKRKAIGTLAIAPDGTKIAAGFGSPTYHQSGYNQVAKVWDLASDQELASLEGHVNTICSVAFSPDGKLLATASDDQQVKLWSANDWRPVQTFSGTERFKSVVFSPDGNWVVAGGATGAITVWETAGDRRPVRRLTGHTSGLQQLAFSPDGRTLASASWDNTVKLWDPLSGRETRTLRDHADWISCVAFSPDGNTLATGSFDSTVRLYQAASTEEIAAMLAADQTTLQTQATRRRQRQEQRAAGGNFAIKTAVLDQYAGHFEGGLTVSVQDSHLAIYPIQGEQGSPIALYPESERQFICRDREIDVTFVKDQQGLVLRVIVCVEGEGFEARKIIDNPD